MLGDMLHTSQDQSTIFMNIMHSKPREEPQGNGVGDAGPLCTLLPNQQGGVALRWLEEGVLVD